MNFVRYKTNGHGEIMIVTIVWERKHVWKQWMKDTVI